MENAIVRETWFQPSLHLPLTLLFLVLQSYACLGISHHELGLNQKLTDIRIRLLVETTERYACANTSQKWFIPDVRPYDYTSGLLRHQSLFSSLPLVIRAIARCSAYKSLSLVRDTISPVNQDRRELLNRV